MDALVGTATTVRIELQSPTGTLIPDPGSLSYRIFDTAGAPLGDAVPVETVSNTSSIDVPITAEQATIGEGRRFEKRTVLVNWTTKGKSYSARETLRIIPFMNTNASPKQVRSALGLADDELDDDEIDLVAAYLSIQEMIGETALVAALASGTFDEIYANNAIVAEAALQILPTLMGRMLAKSTDGVITAERYLKGLDIPALQQSLIARRDTALVSFTDVVSTPAVFVTLVTPVDVITGQ